MTETQTTMQKKLELIITKNAHTIRFGESSIKVDNPTYREYDMQGTKTTKVEIKYSPGISKEQNEELIKKLYNDLKTIIPKKDEGLRAEKKEYFGREYIEISISRDKYGLLIRN